MIHTIVILRLLAVLSLCMLAMPAYAVVALNESGTDSTGTQGLPTAVPPLVVGTNSILGTLRTTSSADNQDWFAITVPNGMKLQNIFLATYQSTDAQGFTGFQTGSSFVGSAGVAGSFTGYAHFGTGATNPGVNSGLAFDLVANHTDLLPIMADNGPSGSAAGATGFTNPLGPGTYTFLFQQTGGAPTSYQFDFVAVPEPAMLGMFLSGGSVLALVAFARAAKARRSQH